MKGQAWKVQEWKMHWQGSCDGTHVSGKTADEHNQSPSSVVLRSILSLK